MTSKRSFRPSRVVVAAGGDLSTLIEEVVAPWLVEPPLSTATDVVVAVPSVDLARDPHGAPRLLARSLKTEHRAVRIVAPSRAMAGALLSTGQSNRWEPVTVSPNAAWLDRAWILSTLNTEGTLVFAGAFNRNHGSRSPVIGSWVRFAHPRQRLAAGATGRRDGITAEIASAFHPSLILLVNVDGISPLVLASTDQIAAELVVRAIQDVRRPARDEDEEDAIGPWEDPLIQRATELGLGVTWPGEIELHALWSGAAEAPARTHFLALVEQIRVRLGIPHPLKVHLVNP